MQMAPAVRFKAGDVFYRSNTGIVGSNHILGMNVWLHFSAFVLYCVGSGLATG
jgi:hypothetical protein